MTTRDSPQSNDPFDLARFERAQTHDYATALAELRSGQKRSHWMWYVFPQIAGLGSSAMSQRYAIRSRSEASAYLTHPLLGARLIECSDVVLAVQRKSAFDIFGSPDDMKLRSSATLFKSVSKSESVFACLLTKYFDGHDDSQTLKLLASIPS